MSHPNPFLHDANRQAFTTSNARRLDVPNNNSSDSEEDKWWSNEEPSAPKPTQAATTDRMTQWPSNAEPSRPKPTTHVGSQMNNKKSARRYSVQKPIREQSKGRQKLQNAKAGIKIVTNFSRHQGSAPVVEQAAIIDNSNAPQGGRFVDMAALKRLEREQRVADESQGFWNSMKGILPSKSQAAEDDANPNHIRKGIQPPNITRVASRRGKGLVPAPIKLENDLSPSDRPIVIGISIPSARLAHHATSPQTAHSQSGELCVPTDNHDMPETPTIIITPAQNPSIWGPLDADNRAASSVYSRATESTARHNSEVAIVQNYAWQNSDRKQSNARESVGTIFDEDETPASSEAAKHRIMSSCTIFEEDSTPILTKTITLSPTDIKHTSVSPPGNRASSGWWNYITTPFLTRSNTFASPLSTNSVEPPVPKIGESVAGAVAAKNVRYWEKSAFSPLTPETTTTISSDTWWDKRDTMNGMSKGDTMSPSEYQTYDSQSGTLPFMLAPSQTVLDRSRNITNQEPMPTEHLGVQRDASMRSIVSPSDRETSVMLDVASLGISNVHVTNTSTVHNDQDAQLSEQIPSQATAHDLNEGRVPAAFAGSTGPPPYSPPRRAYIPKYRAVFPPGHAMNAVNLQEPPSPGPVSPGLQRAVRTSNNIQMSEVPLTPAPRRPINLNSGYTQSPRPVAATMFAPPPKKAIKVEKKRQRYEKEEDIAHKAGGLWRGRGCIPKRGCYARSGAEGRKRRRCWFGLIAAFLAMIILIVVLATQLHHSTPAPQPSQWLNLTGFPPMFTGISTVAGPENPVANTACVFPATLWSCSLPKEIQHAESASNSPDFRIQIQWNNSTAANATFANVTRSANLPTRSFVGNAVSAGQFIRRMVHMIRGTPTFTPSPTPPSIAEQVFLGNTTDGVVSDNKAGEATPFYMTFLSTTSGPDSTPAILRRDSNTTNFPNISSLVPAPSVNANGTAAAANLLPLPIQQPIRLYDRGLSTEHYGFYTYFDRSIFLQSTALLNSSDVGNSSSSNSGEVLDDENGGSLESAARFRCTWAQTRYLVQIWTRSNGTKGLMNATSQANFLNSASNLTAATANDFESPGSHPYPVTITTDRHGGNVDEKMIYCYELDAKEQIVAGSGKLWPEHRNAGGNGVVINPAPALVTAGSSSEGSASLGGFDGGDTGCSCQWQNWNAVI